MSKGDVPCCGFSLAFYVGGAFLGHLASLAVLVAMMLGVLVPLDMRLLRKRVLGD